jgi:muramoyltetrapeptide carboxypeptidase LdcA involved in peptidoglycan recycling
MIIPKYLNDNDTLGVTACSCGVLKKLPKYEQSINNVKKYGNFNIIETNNVRTDGVVSSDRYTRKNELESLYKDDNVKAITIASGGDFLSDMLSVLDYDVIKNNVKWLCGSSDPTSLLFTVTTNLDIATIYSPCNMSGFNIEPLHESYVNYFEILKGDLVKQCKYDKYEGNSFTDELDTDNKWININGDVLETGILIGGCIDTLKDIIGTRFDKTKEFIEKYKDKGIIWYFDVFSMTSEGLYNTLVQFRNAGWFNYTKAILIGKVCIPGSFVDMTYEELIERAIPDIKVIYKFDVGHVKPSFTMINGMKVRIVSNDKEGYLEYL